ncbi:MAG: type II/IV secretion system ATPase subunit, partial [Halobacteriota archaeon]
MEAEYQKALQRNPHLGTYIQDFVNRTGNRPEFITSLSKDIQDNEYLNLILPVGDPVFIHLYGTPEMGEIGYYTIEPPLNDLEKAKYDAIMDIILERSANEPVPKNEEKLKELISKLLNEAVEIGIGGQISVNEKLSIIEKLIPTQKKVPVTQQEFNNLQYHIERNIIGSGPIEPIIRDPHLEDIHSIGVAGVFIVHKILGMMKTNLSFGNEEGLDH